MSSNMPASLANGRYQLGQLVGRGGMAEVRVALDTRLGRTVAIKIMRADLANDKIFLSRFRREAHSVAQMNNPNIVNIYDSGEETVMTDSGGTERLPYLVMEFVKGQTLRDVIKANGPLSQRDAEQVMLGVLNALEYSHHMGIREFLDHAGDLTQRIIIGERIATARRQFVNIVTCGEDFGTTRRAQNDTANFRPVEIA